MMRLELKQTGLFRSHYSEAVSRRRFTGTSATDSEA